MVSTTSKKMRDLASCFSEHAVKVSDSSCSGSSSSTGASSSILDPSAHGRITSVYRSVLSTNKELLISVSWTRTHCSIPTISIAINGSQQQLLKKSKGSRSFVSGDSMIGVYWDISSAKYVMGPEPVHGFYLIIVADGEFVLPLGDMSREYVKKFEEKGVTVAEFSAVGRREKVVWHGHSLWSRFRDHEVVIKCKGDMGWDRKKGASELVVSIDRRKVVQVGRVDWNFRGNQIVFVDGSPVDMMWDVHDWWFGGGGGHAVFLFRARSTLESRLWLEERCVPGFSLLIEACNSP